MFLNGTMNSLTSKSCDFLSFLASLGLSNHLETISSPSEVGVHGWRFQQGLTPFSASYGFYRCWPGLMRYDYEHSQSNFGGKHRPGDDGFLLGEMSSWNRFHTPRHRFHTCPVWSVSCLGFKCFREEKVRFWCAAKSWEFKIGNLVP